MTRKRPPPRTQRWGDAITKASASLDKIKVALDDLDNALGDLRSVQEEYEEWRDNLPENLVNSSLGEKLEVVCDLGIEDLAQTVRDAVEESEGVVEEARGIDLPVGFGRD